LIKLKKESSKGQSKKIDGASKGETGTSLLGGTSRASNDKGKGKKDKPPKKISGFLGN